MSRRESLDLESFVKVYVPMAKAGKSALEIARELGLAGTDKQIVAYVTVKASNVRAELKRRAELAAKEAGLSPEKTGELVKATVAKMPKLSTRGKRSTKDIVSVLDSILSRCDGVETESSEQQD